MLATTNEQLCVWRFHEACGRGEPEPVFNVGGLSCAPLKSGEEMDLLSSVRTKFAYCDSFMVLDSGIILGRKQEGGEVFSFEFENEDVKQLSVTQGYEVREWVAVAWDTVAKRPLFS